jgi:hypothetical protein
VWDEFCRRQGAPDGVGLIEAVKDYERREMAERD